MLLLCKETGDRLETRDHEEFLVQLEVVVVLEKDLERLVKWGIGARGEKGDTGDTGSVGQQGPVGPQAPTCPRGVKGAKGLRGVAGIQGPPGIQGSVDSTGG